MAFLGGLVSVSPDHAVLRADGIAPAGRAFRRLVPARSPQWVVVWVLRSALAPDWTPTVAAAALVDRIPDPVVLRDARRRLRSVTRHRSTVHQARALATLNLALDLAMQPTEDDGNSGSRTRAEGEA